MKHLHWDLIGFDSKTEDKVFNGIVYISTIGQLTEKAAIAAAQSIIKKNGYHLTKVYECNLCDIQKELVSSMKKMTD